jgi:thymidylate synthase (FAD)
MPLSPDQQADIDAQRAATTPTRRATAPGIEAHLYSAIPVLDHGFVRVVDYMGDDAAIVQAARVSYGAGTKAVSDDRGLIRYLMRHWHSTPFEMAEIKLHVKLPIFVARQWIRHRTANVNEYSARYSILDGEFYIPAPEHLAAQSTANHQGRGAVLEGAEAQRVLDILRGDAARAYDHYQAMLGTEGQQGLARELARMNLPANIYTQWYWKTDLHNLFHFLHLRADPHAQYEIRAYAEAICRVVEDWVPHAWGAFRDYRLGGAHLSAQGLDCVRRMLRGEAVTQETSGMSKGEWREFRLIESVLMRIPVPPIFVFELGNSKWELIDGLQRISTLLQFMGELESPEEKQLEAPQPLIGTQYLPSLEGAMWSEQTLEKYQESRQESRVETDLKAYVIESGLQRSIKRSKIGIQMLEKKSDDKSKFDLFQRLNSGGMAANAQELRNCTIIMSNEEFFGKMKELVENADFKAMIPLGGESVAKANDYEHVSRIIAFGFREYPGGIDIEDFVDKALIDISQDEPREAHDMMLDRVAHTLSRIRSACGPGGLRPWQDSKFQGRIGRTSIEIVAIGVLRNLDAINALGDPDKFVLERTKAFWESGQSINFTAAGVSGTDRVARTIPFGADWYDPAKHCR